MRSATRLYRVNLALGTLGLVVVAVAVAGVLQGVRVDSESLAAMVSACRSVLPSLGAGGYLHLALIVLAGSSLVLAARSVARQLLATRRYLRDLAPTGETVAIDGTTCHLIAGGEPRALCAGYLAPRIYISRGAIEALSPVELRAVIAHELHHRRRRDPLRLLLARALGDSLLFLPALPRISARYAELVELAADEAAVRALSERRTLAGALLKFGDLGLSSVAVAAIAPERVDHLSGDPAATRWGIPRPLLATSALLGATLLVALGLLVAVVDPAPVNLGLLLAQSCALMILAGTLATMIARGALRRLAGRFRAS